MPIEQVKPVQLSDVWNPMQYAGPAMQMGQMAYQNERLRAMESKTDDTELLNILKIADLPPTATYFAAKKLLGKHGFELDPVDFSKFEPLYKQFTVSGETNGGHAPETLAAGNELVKLSPLFRAHVQSEQARWAEADKVRGMQQLTSRATGKATSMAEAEAVAGSPAIQKEIGGAIAQTPLEQARTEQTKHNLELFKVQEQKAAQQLELLSNYSRPTFMDLDTEGLYLQSLGKDTKAGSIVAGMREDNDDLAMQHGTLTKPERIQAGQDVDQQITDLRMKQRDLSAKIRQGMQLSGTDRSFDVNGFKDELTAVNEAIKLKLAEKPYLKSPTPETFAGLRAAQSRYDGLIKQQQDKIAVLQNAQLGLSSAATNEKQAEFLTKQDYERRVGIAQARFSQGKLTPEAAGKIAGELGVKTSDVLKGGENPNKPLVSIEQKQETAESAKVGEGFGEQYVTLQKSAISANNKINKLNRMEQLMTGVETGKLTPMITEIQALGKSLGIEVDASLGPKQALEALSNEVALELRNPSGGAGMPGALSDKDREFLVSMTPGLSKTPEGNKLIIETGRKIAKRDQDVARMARDYRKKKGHLDEGFYDVLQNYADAHPLFKEPIASLPAAGGLSQEEKTELEALRKKHGRR